MRPSAARGSLIPGRRFLRVDRPYWCGPGQRTGWAGSPRCLPHVVGLEKEIGMARGTVKWFNAEKGYGFIAPEDGSADVFVHYSDIVGTGYRTLTENQQVEFEVGQSDKGTQATSVRTV